MDETSERLVRVETKLDSLIQLNDVRLSAFEAKQRHDVGNLDQKITALKVEIDKTNANLGWAVKLIIGLVMTAILASAGIVAMRPPAAVAAITK